MVNRIKKNQLMKKADDLPPLEGNEEKVKEGKVLNILTTNKVLTRLPVLLAQVRSGNTLYKLKKEIRKLLYLLYQHTKIIKTNLQMFK